MNATPTVSDIKALQKAGSNMIAGGQALIGGAKKLAKKLSKSAKKTTKKTSSKKKTSKK